MISFGATYISSALVQKNDHKKDTKKDVEVSFIELDPKNKVDLEAVHGVCEKWNLKDSYLDIRYLFFMFCARRGFSKGAPNTKFYAITTQKDNFNNPKTDDMLAVAEVEELDKDKLELKFLHVEPKHNNDSDSNSRFKYVGTALLDSLKNISKNKNIVVDSALSAVEFYKKNGFKLTHLKDEGYNKINMIYEA